MSFRIDDLQRYAKTHWFSLERLETLKKELGHRRRAVFPRVRDLNHKVTKRIEQLSNLRDLLADEFENESFRDWFFGTGKVVQIPPEVLIHGDTPLEVPDLVQTLNQIGVENAGFFSGYVETLILGRENWKTQEVEQQLDNRTGKTIRVYSQGNVLGISGLR